MSPSTPTSPPFAAQSRRASRATCQPTPTSCGPSMLTLSIALGCTPNTAGTDTFTGYYGTRIGWETVGKILERVLAEKLLRSASVAFVRPLGAGYEQPAHQPAEGRASLSPPGRDRGCAASALEHLLERHRRDTMTGTLQRDRREACTEPATPPRRPRPGMANALATPLLLLAPRQSRPPRPAIVWTIASTRLALRTR